MSDTAQCIEETAKVVELDGAFVWVEAQAKSACDACKVKGNCATQALSSVVGSSKALRLKMPNTFDARMNEQIIIGWGRANFLKTVAKTYLLPSVSAVVFAIAGSFHSEGAAALCGLIGMSASMAYLGYCAKKVEAHSPNSDIIFLRRLKETNYE